MKKATIIFTIIILLAAASAGWVFKEIFVGQTGEDELITVNIEQGDGLGVISQKLAAAGAIDNEVVFKGYVKLRGYDTSLKHGIYHLPSTYSVRQITNALIAGSLSEITITIPEAWNLHHIAASLISQGVIEDDAQLFEITGVPGSLEAEISENIRNEYEFVRYIPQGISLEGYLFPDTYRIFRNASAEDVVRKMLDNFETKYNSQIEERMGATSFSLHEVLTLAAIVSKEAKTPSDKRIVAGVFMNRLGIGQALQSDPTVNYVTKKVTDNPSLDDISVDSLYNTYKHPGLPPGPVSNPGIEDILAVIDPVDHDYYYFINTKGGELIFSKTFQEHVDNRNKYGQ